MYSDTASKAAADLTVAAADPTVLYGHIYDGAFGTSPLLVWSLSLVISPVWH